MLLSFFRSTEEELTEPSKREKSLSIAMMWTYRIACVTLTGLNTFWFYKMFMGAIKVLTNPRAATKIEQEITES